MNWSSDMAIPLTIIMSDEESGLRTEAGNESMDPPVKKIRRFEDLIAWQKARELTKRIYSLTRQGNFERDHGLRSDSTGRGIGDVKPFRGL
jgi:hypothetical protein